MNKKQWIILLIAVLAVVGIVLAGVLLLRAPAPEQVDIPTAAPTPTPYRETLEPAGDIVPLTDEEATPAPTAAPDQTPGGAQTAKPAVTPAPGTTAQAATPAPTASATTPEYGYTLFRQNVTSLMQKYPDDITSIRLGETAFGRDVLCLRIGNPEADHKVLLVAGARGNEYGLSLVMMKQIETYLSDTSSLFRGKTYREVLSKSCLYCIPMLNPDGVELCLNGLVSAPAEEKANLTALLQNAITQGQISQMPAENEAIPAWSANGKGIEVAYNFGAGAIRTNAVVDKASCAKYPGVPFATPESRAVRELCSSVSIDVLALFSGQGNTIDWSFGQSDNGLSMTLASGISQSSSYPVIENGLTPDLCVTVEAYQWFIQEYGRPAFKISTGSALPYSSQDILEAWRSLSAVPLYLADKAQWSYESGEETNTTPDPEEPGFEYGEVD